MAITKGNYSTLGTQDGNNTTATVSGAIDSTGCGALLCVFSWEGDDATAGGFTIVDKLSGTPTSNTWELVKKATSAGVSAFMYACFNPGQKGASHTVEVVPSAARPFKRCGFVSVNGTFANNSAVTPAALNATGSSTTCGTTAITTTQAAIIFQWGVNDNGQAMQDGGGGSWGPSNLDVGTGTSRVIASVVQATGVTWTPTLVITGGAVAWASVTVALSETGAVNASTTPPGIAATATMGAITPIASPPPPFTLTTITG